MVPEVLAGHMADPGVLAGHMVVPGVRVGHMADPEAEGNEYYADLSLANEFSRK
ncbi:hypothetical protein JCM16418A_09050 [Paenibacillus pini]